MPEKPSYMTSTLSQLAVASMACYLTGCLIFVIGGGYFKNQEAMLIGFNGLRWSVESLVIGYLAARKVNGEGKPAEPAQPTEVKP